MNAAVFKSVFQTIGPDHPAVKLQHRRYRRRWDWHLRNLIYALMPPAAVYGSVLLIRWFMADEIAAYDAMMAVKEEEAEAEKSGLQIKKKTLEERLQAVEDFLRSIEEERQRAERDKVVENAKSILRPYIKQCTAAKSQTQDQPVSSNTTSGQTLPKRDNVETNKKD